MPSYKQPVMKATKWAVYKIDFGEITTLEYIGNFIDCSFYIMSKEKLDRCNYIIQWVGYYD